jgi:predicted MFS family arabinose efflux permease
MLITARAFQGAFAATLIASAGLFGTFLFLTYYLQQTASYSTLVAGVAFLPLSGALIVASNLSTTRLMPRVGPKPLIALGMLAAPFQAQGEVPETQARTLP